MLESRLSHALQYLVVRAHSLWSVPWWKAGVGVSLWVGASLQYALQYLIVRAHNRWSVPLAPHLVALTVCVT